MINLLSRKSAIGRWGILFLISLVIAANYYFYDALSSIKSVLQSELHLSNTDYGLIISFYSFPNTFLLMAIIGGILLDKWGIRLTGFIFVFFTTIGALTTAYGASEYYRSGGPGHVLMSLFLRNYSPELKMMMLGRLFFGLGAETSIIVFNKIIVKWFKGKELALAFGLNLAVARIGTAMALILSPVLVGKISNGHYLHFTNAAWLGAMLVLISLFIFIFYIAIDFKKESTQEVKIVEEKFHFNDIWSLFRNPSFIYITLMCVTFYSAVFPFLSYAPDLFFNKYKVNREISGMIASILPFGTILFTPLFGWFVDKKGKSATLMIFGSLILILVHSTLTFTKLTPYIPIFCLGIAFSLVPAAMWPAVARIVEEKRLGTAYGIMTSIQNIGLFAFPILAGKILDFTPKIIDPQTKTESLNYFYTLLMFIALGLLGLLFAFLLKAEDRKRNTGIELPSAS